MINSLFNTSKKWFLATIIAALLMQSSGLGFLNVTGAKAATANIAKLVFTSSVQYIKSDTASTKITVETRNNSNIAETVDTDDEKITISGTGQFSVDQTNWNDSTIDIDINNGSNSIDFYYKNTKEGKFNITASPKSPKEWIANSQYIYVDNTAPTGSIAINNNADVTNGKDYDQYSADCTDNLAGVNLTLSYSDDLLSENTLSQSQYADQTNFSTHYMKLSNKADMSADGSNDNSGKWIAYTSDYYAKYNLPWYIGSDEGIKTVYVQFKDEAGNESAIYSDQIFYSVYSTIPGSTVVLAGTNSYNPVSEVSMEINASGTTSLFVSRYTQNPTSEDIDGITNLGKYFDFSIADDSKINFPVMIKIYYTQAELDNAKITDPADLKGIYYFDFGSNSWKLYANTGVVTTSDKDGYAGYVWANADHFTPMTTGADVTAPEKPYNFKAEAKDGSVKLTWDKVTDADHYDIRYRKSTDNNESVSYTYVARLTDNNTEIINLENGVEYEFGVRAVDEYDNMSDYSVIVSTPVKTESTVSSKTTATTYYAYYYNYDYSDTQTEETEVKDENVNTDNITEEEPEIITEGLDNTNEPEEGQTQGARTAVTLGIIIIAIGAALGGYYGYQWWLGTDEEEDDEEEENKSNKSANNKEQKNKKNKANRRW